MTAIRCLSSSWTFPSLLPLLNVDIDSVYLPRDTYGIYGERHSIMTVIHTFVGEERQFLFRISRPGRRGYQDLSSAQRMVLEVVPRLGTNAGFTIDGLRNALQADWKNGVVAVSVTAGMFTAPSTLSFTLTAYEGTQRTVCAAGVIEVADRFIAA